MKTQNLVTILENLNPINPTDGFIAETLISYIKDDLHDGNLEAEDPAPLYDLIIELRGNFTDTNILNFLITYNLL